MSLELFTSKTCQYCEQVRDQLELDGVDFVEYDVDADREARKRLGELVGTNVMVPVVVEDGRVTHVGVAGRGCYVNTA
jgi:glutaredoxin